MDYEDQNGTPGQKGYATVGTKLTENHLQLTSWSKMRVDLATQVLSRSVCFILNILNSDSENSSMYSSAISFIWACNNFFDVFNSKKFREEFTLHTFRESGYDNKPACAHPDSHCLPTFLNKWNEEATKLYNVRLKEKKEEKEKQKEKRKALGPPKRDSKEFKEDLEKKKRWKAEEGQSPNPKMISQTTFSTVQVTTGGVIGLFKDYVGKDKLLPSFRLRSLCQDPLESTFSQIRGACGGERQMSAPRALNCISNLNLTKNLNAETDGDNHLDYAARGSNVRSTFSTFD